MATSAELKVSCKSEGEVSRWSAEGDSGAMVWLSAAEQQNANNHTAITKVGRRRGDCMAGVLSPKLRDVLRPDLRVSVTGLSKTTTHRRLCALVSQGLILAVGQDKPSLSIIQGLFKF